MPAFACTDVTYLDGRLYVVTGYCDGDFVLCASEEAGSWEWGPYAWGGKGDKPGQFNTAHGIFAFDDHIFVANREAHQVLEFTKEGKLLRSMPDIPAKSRICNIAHAEKYFVMNALEPLGDQKSAPVYAHTGEKLLSTIVAGELGIPVLKNLHQVWCDALLSHVCRARLALRVGADGSPSVDAAGRTTSPVLTGSALCTCSCTAGMRASSQC